MIRQNGRRVDVGVSAETKETLDALKPHVMVLAGVLGTAPNSGDVAAAKAELERLGTVEPIFDPTGFMRHSAATESWIRFLGQFMEIQGAATRLHADLMAMGERR